MTLIEHCEKLKEFDKEKKDVLGNYFNQINEDRREQYENKNIWSK